VDGSNPLRGALARPIGARGSPYLIGRYPPRSCRGYILPVMISVIVLAAQAAVRAGLVSLLGPTKDLQVRAAGIGGEVSGLAGAVRELPPGLPLDVLVIAERPGPEALEGIAGELPPTVLVSDDPLQAARLLALEVPAWAVLASDSGPAELAAAIRAVHCRLLAGTPQLLSALFATQRSLPPDELAERLSPRESEVLGLIATGLANKQIAWELGVSEHTVKFHTSSIYAKLGVTNRTEAVRRGIERGLLHL
jgi:DNA-binding NarL/FixJ family response regulator